MPRFGQAATPIEAGAPASAGRFASSATRIDRGDSVPLERAPLRAPAPKERDSWVTLGRRVIENAPTMFKQAAGGILQSLIESEPTPPVQLSTSERAQWDEDVAKPHRAAIEAARTAGTLPGQRMYEEATADLAENAPNVDPNSLKGYAYDITQGIVQMVPAVAATLVTRSPTVGATVIGSQVYGPRYGESRESGRSPDAATADAIFYAAAEAIPEMVPLGVLMKPGRRFLARTLATAGAEAVQETMTEALQMGYDAGVLDEKTPWSEVPGRLARAGIVGAGVGAGMAAGSQPFQPREEEKPKAELRSSAEIHTFAKQREAELEGREDPESREELSFLRANRNAPGVLAEGYGWELDTTRPMVTREDIDSPIPTELIEEGRALLLPAPEMRVGPGGQAGTRAQFEAAAREREELGMTPDVERNLERIEARRPAPAEPLALPPPDQTVYVDDAGQAGRIGDVERVAQARERTEQERRDLGITPDVESNLARLVARQRATARAPLPALPPPDPTLYVDQEGGAGRVEQRQAAAAAEVERARTLGLTPDAEQAAERHPGRPRFSGAPIDAAPPAETPAPAPAVTPAREPFDPRLKSEESRGMLQGLASELVRRGGVAYIKDQHDRIQGRTPSQNPQWFQNLTAQSDTKVSVEQVQRAVDKALEGKILGAREKRVIQVMLDHIDEENAADLRRAEAVSEYLPPEDIRQEVGLEDPGEDLETALVARALEIDENAVEQAAIEFADDDAGYYRAVKAIIDQAAARASGGREGARAPAPAESAAEPAERDDRGEAGRVPQPGAATDLLGDDTRQAQAVADEQRRRDEARSPNRDVSVETGDPTDLFSKARGQRDLVADAQPRKLRGTKIDDEWTTFAPASGTLGIARDKMPQIKAEHRGALANFLKARGIEGTEREVPASELKPTQREFSEAKVKKAKEFEGGDRAILVSSDGHVLDGHHQWLAKADKGEPIRVIQLDAPIKRLLTEVAEFPSVETAGGEAPATGEGVANTPPKADEAARRHGFDPAEVGWIQGRGPLGRGKFMASARGQTSNLHETADAAVAELKTFVGASEAGAAERARIEAAEETLAAKLKNGTSPSFNEWQAAFPQLRDGHTYLRQPDISPFLVKHFGFSKANIRKPLGKAAGTLRSDSGAEYPIVYFNRLADVLRTTPTEQADAPRARTEAAIQDFGEKIVGARKDYATTLKDAQSVDIASAPLSESWPEPDYQKLLDSGTSPWAVAFVHAARDEIPTRPQKSWRVKDWAKQVETLRKFSMDLLTNATQMDLIKQRLQETAGLKSVYDRAELYLKVGHEKSLKGVTVSAASYSVHAGKKYDPPRIIWTVEMKAPKTAMSHWPRELGMGDTREAAIADFKKKWLETAPAEDEKKAITFNVYRNGNAYALGRKVGRAVVILKGGFEKVKEAREYLASNHDELVQLFERTRVTPSERRGGNAPRVGADHRNGADVTPEIFSETFGFRGVQFGNYVEGARRQQDLNETYDALMDMAGVLDVPAKALSLNGELGLAFGARGKGGIGAASAHYEQDQIVINLTKRQGAGALSHEWFHALDNYFSRKGGKPSAFVTARTAAGEGVRPEMDRAFAAVRVAIQRSPMANRSRQLDRTRSKDYWSTGEELAARAFEAYVIAKLQDQGAANDYLANIVSKEFWDAQAALGMGKENTYPYPTAEEIGPIREAFDNFFQTVETRETDAGVEMFALRPEVSAKATGIESDLRARLAEVGISDRVAMELRDVITNKQGAAMAGATGRYYRRMIEIALGTGRERWTLDHEIVHALRDLGVIRQTEWAALSRAAQDRLADVRERYSQLNLSDGKLVEEAVADLHADWAAGRSEARGFVRTALERIRNFFEALGNALRGNGFQSASDVFERIGSGEMGARDATLSGLKSQPPAFATDGRPPLAVQWDGKFYERVDIYGNRSHDPQGKGAPNVFISVLPGGARPYAILDADSGVRYGPEFRTLAEAKKALTDGVSRELAMEEREQEPDLFFEDEAGNDEAFAIAPPTDSAAFRKWFGDSKVVDENGEPLVVYRGAGAKNAEISIVAWFTANPQTADVYAGARDPVFRNKEFDAEYGTHRKPGGHVQPVYLSMRNPAEVDFATIANANQTTVERYTSQGYDGLTRVNERTGERWYVPFRMEQIKSAIGNRGTFDPENPDIAYALAARPKFNPQRAAAATRQRAAADSRFLDEAIFRFQDKFRYLDKAQKAAARARGLAELPEAEDAYLAELRYHGMAGSAIEDFQRDHVEPLVDAISKAGVTVQDVDRYLHARHAPEANAQLKRINPNRQDNDALSGMSDAEAARVVAGYRSAGKLTALEGIAKRVDAITKAQRDLLVSAGLETAETIKKWEDTYKHYVPLHREGFDDVTPSRGKGFSITGRQKRRAGSERAVEHILAHAVAQYETTVVRAEKNKVARAMLEFAKNNPNASLYEVDKVEYTPSFGADGLVTYRPQRGFQLADNVLVVKVAGKDHTITFNERSLQAMRIAHAMKNLGGGDSGPIINTLTRFTRYLALVNTGANPEFIISNFARDLQTAGYNLSSTDADKLKWQIIKDVGKSWRGIRAFQQRKGHPWATHFDAFRKAGAQTGWMDHYKDVAHREKRLVSMVEDLRSDSSLMKIKRGLKAVEEFVERENTAVENAIRLSAFVHARQAGLTDAKAARLAKELTVNFNRRGDYGQVMNALYLFYNASIQGSARIIAAGAKSKKVRALMGATVVAAMFLDILNRELGGDDEDGKARYDKIPDYVKERNLVIMLPSGSGDYLQIPLPWGYNVFHVMGQTMGEALTKRGFKATEGAMRVAGAVWGAFNPIGSEASITQMVSPTITDPLVQWGENMDWSGRQLRPEGNPFDVDKPKSQQYWNSVREPSRWVTERLNELTGGSEVRPGAIDINPEAIDLIIDTFTGGAGRFVTDTLSTPIKAIKGDDVESYEIPLARRVYGRPGQGALFEEYYRNADAVRITEKEAKHYQEIGDAGSLAALKSERAGEYAMILARRNTESQIAKLRQQRNRVEVATSLSDEEKRSRTDEINARIEDLMQRFNRLHAEKVGD